MKKSAIILLAALALACAVDYALTNNTLRQVTTTNAALPVTQPHREPRNVAILIYDGVELLDFAGPGEVFSVAGQGGAFRVYTVAATAEPITSQGFLRVIPQHTITNAPRPDILIVPGGATSGARNNRALMEWIRRTAQGAEVVMSVCTGAFVLADAGLLDGQEATTWYAALDRLREAAPRATVVANRRFVDNGHVVTAAGVSTGIDASLRVVSRLLSPEAARSTAQYMEYRWEP